MPTPTYDLIASNVLTSSAATVTFSSIGSSYRDLIVVADCILATGDFVRMIVNSDTGANSPNVQMFGDGGGTGNSNTATNYFPMNADQSATRVLGIVQILDYAQTDKHKPLLIRSNANSEVTATAGRWANTAAITSVQFNTAFSNQFQSGSRFYLYGLVS